MKMYLLMISLKEDSSSWTVEVEGWVRESLLGGVSAMTVLNNVGGASEFLEVFVTKSDVLEIRGPEVLHFGWRPGGLVGTEHVEVLESGETLLEIEQARIGLAKKSAISRVFVDLGAVNFTSGRG